MKHSVDDFIHARDYAASSEPAEFSVEDDVRDIEDQAVDDMLAFVENTEKEAAHQASPEKVPAFCRLPPPPLHDPVHCRRTAAIWHPDSDAIL